MTITLRAPAGAVTLLVISGLALLLGAALLLGGQVLGRLPSLSGEIARIMRIVGYLVYPGFLIFLVVNGLPSVLHRCSRWNRVARPDRDLHRAVRRMGRVIRSLACDPARARGDAAGGVASLQQVGVRGQSAAASSEASFPSGGSIDTSRSERYRADPRRSPSQACAEIPTLLLCRSS